MFFKIITLLCFLVSVCTVNAIVIKIETPDTKFCVVQNSTYTVNVDGPFFKFQNAELAKAYIIQNTTDGIWYINQAGRNANFHLDEFIYNSLYNDSSYEYAPNSTISCAQFIATYMCSYTFVYQDELPCNSLCEPISCAGNFSYSGVVIAPNLSECLAQGSDQSNCSAINMIGFMGDWKHKVVTVILPDADVHPGGLVRGSLLGFGVLIGLLLVIGSLGIIMKFQNK